MAKVTRLNVMITASTKGLSLGINKAQGMLKSLGREAKAMQRHMGGVFNNIRNIATRGFTAFGVAATGAAAGLAYLTKQSIDAIGDTNDLAKSLGLTYNELRAIQFAAGQAGVDADALNSAFAKMSDTLGTAFGGNAAAIKAFEGIGLSIADLEKMSPAQQFEAIANAINKIEDPSKRMAAARDVFGKSGGALISLFENAGQAINEAANTLGFFGINLSQLDVTKIDNAGDAMGTLSLMIEGIGNQLARIVSPYIQQVTEDTIAWTQEMGGVGPAVDMAVQSALSALDSMLSMVEDVEIAWNQLGRTITGVGLIVKDITGVVTQPFTDIYNAAKGNETDNRLQGIPEHRREQARALLEKQGGFASEKVDVRAGIVAENQDYQTRIDEIRKQQAERGTLGQRFSNWRAGADFNANIAAGVSDPVVPAPYAGKGSMAEFKKSHTGFGRPIYQDKQQSMMNATPGYKAKQEEMKNSEPILQVLRNIEANTGKNKIAFAG